MKSVNPTGIATNRATTEIARFLLRKLCDEGQVPKFFEVVFAHIVEVDHPSRQYLTVLGIDATFSKDEWYPFDGGMKSFFKNLLLNLHGPHRTFTRALMVEIVPNGGGSVGGSIFRLRCPHNNNGSCNDLFFCDNFKGHKAYPELNDRIWVEGAFQHQGLEAELHRLATSHATEQGWLIVPAPDDPGRSNDV